MFGKKKKDGDKKSEKKKTSSMGLEPTIFGYHRLRLRRPTPYPLGHKDIQPISGEEKSI